MHEHIVDGLIEDHQVIENALTLLEEAVDLLEKGKLDPAVLEELILFLMDFADKCHHGKEEEVLFPCMERRGLYFWGTPLSVMTCEHGMGRYLLRNSLISLKKYIRGDGKALNELRKYTSEYIKLLSEHISKENTVLFNMARQMIPSGEGIKEAEEIEERIGHEKLLEKLSNITNAIEKAKAL